MESPYARQGQTACIKTHLNQSSQPWGPAVHATPRPQRVHLRPDCRQGWQCTNRTQLNRHRYTLIYLSLIPIRLILWRRRFLPTRWPIRSIVATSSIDVRCADNWNCHVLSYMFRLSQHRTKEGPQISPLDTLTSFPWLHPPQHLPPAPLEPTAKYVLPDPS